MKSETCLGTKLLTENLMEETRRFSWKKQSLICQTNQTNIQFWQFGSLKFSFEETKRTN